ncbi:hypothetical protein SNE40_014288 [Patella caerulea]|uniref:Uncharacterized protein n=1 Tax=Patella caerulea TaxID=87958 RepID=A0AAN8JKV8_PATCE
MKITTSLSAVPTAMAPEAFLSSLPQSFCFTQPTFTTAGFTTAPQITPPSSSPLNMIGFPINQLTNQFVHQIPLSQITSDIQGFPINPAILTMATGHGQFLQGGNQFSPLIMNPQQPIMTNALLGSLANTINSVTPLTIPSAPLTLNNTDTAMTDVNQITEQVQGHNEINTATNITINEAFDNVAPLPVYRENTNLPENLRQANTDSSNDSESFFGGGDTTEAPLEVYEKDCECETPTEKFVSEPLCNAFQDEDEGNSEIMRRYRRNLNSKKKKIPKENMEEEKGEKIKKECLSDDGDYCEIVTEKKVFSSIDVGDYNEGKMIIQMNNFFFRNTCTCIPVIRY